MYKRQDELATDSSAQEAYREAEARGDPAVVAVWASEAIDLITDVPSASELVARLVAEAEDALAQVRNR